MPRYQYSYLLYKPLEHGQDEILYSAYCDLCCFLVPATTVFMQCSRNMLCVQRTFVFPRMHCWMPEDFNWTRLSDGRDDHRLGLPLHCGIRRRCHQPIVSRASSFGVMRSCGYQLSSVGCVEAARMNALGLEESFGSDDLRLSRSIRIGSGVQLENLEKLTIGDLLSRIVYNMRDKWWNELAWFQSTTKETDPLPFPSHTTRAV